MCVCVGVGGAGALQLLSCLCPCSGVSWRLLGSADYSEEDLEETPGTEG